MNPISSPGFGAACFAHIPSPAMVLARAAIRKPA